MSKTADIKKDHQLKERHEKAMLSLSFILTLSENIEHWPQ
jgi:hypothetical protein